MAKGIRAKRKNGEGTFNKNGKGFDFLITVGKKENGAPDRRSFYGLTKELAKARYEEWKHTQTYTVPNEMSEWAFGAWAEYWFKTIACKRNKITTISDDRSILDAHILPALAPIKLNKLTWLDLQRFYDSVCKKPNGKGGTLSPKTIKNIYIVVNRILKAAKKRGLISTNPNENVELPKSPRNKPKRALGMTVQEQLRDYCIEEDTIMSLLIIFLMDTGLRLAEALGLQWSKVNLEESYIKIEQQLQAVPNTQPDAKHKTKLEIIDSTKTTSSIRELPISEDTVHVLKVLRKHYAKNRMKLGRNYSDNDIVFGKEDGCFICDTVFRHYFNDIQEKLEIKDHVRIHDLRHTFATTARDRVPIDDVSNYLGHKSVVTTMDMYVHSDRHKLKNLAKAMGSRFRKEKEDSRKLACEDNEKQPS